MTIINKKNYIEKPNLSIEQLDNIYFRIINSRKDNIISLKYYNKGNILHLTGSINKIDIINNILFIDSKKIAFSNILKIY